MYKLKLFLENFLVYGLGGIISKIVPLVMVPIVTRIMPNSSYYGISDLANTVLSFGQALAVMGMYDAMYRMFFEKNDEKFKKEICSTALIFTICTSIIVGVLMVAFQNVILRYVFNSSDYKGIVYVTAFATVVGTTNSIVSAPTRMQNKRKVFLVMNTMSPLLSYGIAIPMLLSGHYIMALPIAALIASFSCEAIFYLLNKEWFRFSDFKWEHLKPLLAIAIPLLPNFLIYWVFNSSDKLMITNLLDTSSTGIYSVGSKLGHASQLIYTAFAGGWQYFAFSTMKEKNQIENNSKIFEYLGVLSFISTAFIFAWSHLIYDILFTGEYIEGYIIAPYLFLAPLLQMLFQVACNQFLVVKKTWPNMFILLLGAVINIILNFVLIPKIGIEGAAIATLLGYATSDIVGVGVLSHMKLMIVDKKFIIASLLMMGYIFIWRFFFIKTTIFSTVFAVILFCFYVLLYEKDLKRLVVKIKNKKS